MKVKKSFLFYFSSRGIAGIAAILSVMIYTRILSPEEYGELSLMLSVVMMLSAVFFQWIAVSTVRFCASYQCFPNKVTTLIFNYYLRSALLCLLFVVFEAIFFNFLGLMFYEYLVVYFAAVTLGFFVIACQVFNAHKMLMHYAVYSASRPLLVLVLGGGGVYLYNINYVSILVAISLSVLLLAILVPCRLYARSVNNGGVGGMWAYGSPLALSTISILVIDLSDRFMISYFFGNAALAGYAVVSDVVQQASGVLFSIVTLVFFPYLVNAIGEEKEYEQIFKKYVEAVLFCVFIVISIFCFCNELVSQLLFGAGVESDASYLMPFLSAAILMGAIKTHTLDVPLKIAKKTKVLLTSSVIMAIVNIGLNFYFIPEFGALGGGFSTLLAFFFGACISIFVTKGEGLKYLELALFLRAFVGLLFLYITSCFLTNDSIVGILVSLMVYFILMLACILFVNFFDARAIVLKVIAGKRG